MEARSNKVLSHHYLVNRLGMLCFFIWRDARILAIIQPGTNQTTQDECKDVAMQLYGQIPSKSWATKGWTTTVSGAYRAMV